ncbi:hypothetical protein [Kaistia terrae]|uniref:Uncharacterized protein n=1 Tax=Kaistia terrae TaxID=537017 RepID=A0ABW0Q393_9HYPH|nr:hypothetical protein [Kaistia terrae]MCX5581199.1 hypothetical protein [Kaistia terrae]
MIRPCRVLGCGAHTTRYGTFCPTHKSNLRRHGHAEQTAVTKAELAPFVALVRKRIEKNADNATWAHSEARWQTVVDHARAILGEAKRGVPGNRYERTAASEVVVLGEAVTPRAITETVFAMYLLQEHDLRRLRSDEAFRAQLIHRLRGLTEANVDEWPGGRAKRLQRDIPPRAVLIMAQWIGEALGGVGVHLARLEARDREARAASAAGLAEAMRELQ